MVYEAVGTVAVVYFFMGIGLVILLALAFGRQKSKTYRRYLTNLYVAGRIRQEADKEKVDLVKEELNFIKYEKESSKKRIEDLDNVIEQELMNRIGEIEEKKKA